MKHNAINLFSTVNYLHQRDKMLANKVQNYTLRKENGKLHLHVPLLRTGNGVQAETIVVGNRSGKVTSKHFGIEEQYLGLYFYQHANTIESVFRIELPEWQKVGYDILMVVHRPLIYGELVVTYVPDTHDTVLESSLFASADDLETVQGTFAIRNSSIQPDTNDITDLIESYDLNLKLTFQRQLTAA